MKKFQIINIEDKYGNCKHEQLERIYTEHTPYGNLVMGQIGQPFYFEYYDDSNKMLRSSSVFEYEFKKENNLHIITTRNSVYYIYEVIDEK